MFDLIGGLPVHILVLHAFVVIAPVSALVALAYVFRPMWRPVLRWPVGVLAVVTGIAGLVTKESGEKLANRLVPDFETLQAQGTSNAQIQTILNHTQSGDLAGAVGLIFMVAVLIAVVWAVRDRTEPLFGTLVPSMLLTLVAISSVALLGTVFFAGHSGASAAWADVIAATSTGGN